MRQRHFEEFDNVSRSGAIATLADLTNPDGATGSLAMISDVTYARRVEAELRVCGSPRARLGCWMSAARR
jgi:hypothetical protein